MPLFSPKIESFGIDLSDFSIKISQVKKKGSSLFLTSIGEKFFQEGIIKDGVINKEREGDLVEIIKKTISEAKGKKIKTKNIICSLPEENAFIKTIQIPKVAKSEIREAIEFQLESNFPVKLNNVYFDFEIVDSSAIKKSKKIKKSREKIKKEDSLDVSVAVISKKVADSYVSVFKKAGLQPMAFEIESMAVIRSLILNSFNLKPVMILDMGKGGTGVTIFSGKTILFTSHIGISGNDLDKIISKSLKIDISEAEKMKKEIGLLSIKKIKKKSKEEIFSLPRFKVYRVPVTKEKELKNQKSAVAEIDLTKLEKADQVFEALVPILTDLIEQIRQHIQYFGGLRGLKYARGKISKIIVCGGEANLVGITDFISSSLELPVETGNPFVNIQQSRLAKKILGSNLRRESISYATAIGLAIRGAE